MIFGRGKDTKVRVTCTECGKRLKLPADQPGRVFRCPICASSVIAPIQTADSSAPAEPRAEAPAAAPAKPGERPDPVEEILRRGRLKGGPTGSAPAQEVGWRPETRTKPTNRAIQDVMRFLAKANEHLTEVAVDALHSPDMPPEQKERRLTGLRKDRSANLLKEVDRIVSERDDRIRRLLRDPHPERAGVQNEIAEIRAEKKALYAFLRIIFGIRVRETNPEAEIQALHEEGPEEGAAGE